MASYLGPRAFRALFTAFKKFYDNTTNNMNTVLQVFFTSPFILSFTQEFLACHMRALLKYIK